MTHEAAFWDGIAEKYAAKPVDDPEAFERKIAHTRGLLPPDAVVLEVGSGTGSLALRLSDACAHIHGLDVSGEMVRIARSKASAAQTANLTFHTGAFDATFEALEPASVDMVCAFSILHLVPDLDDALSRALALTKPGGVLVSSTVCLGDTWVPYGPILAFMRWIGKAPPVHLLRRAALLEAMQRAGWTDVAEVDVAASSDIAFVTARRSD